MASGILGLRHRYSCWLPVSLQTQKLHASLRLPAKIGNGQTPVIDKELLTGFVDQPHNRVEFLGPAIVKLAKLGITVGVRFARCVFLPQKQTCDPFLTQLLMDLSPIR
jgi:hypothetical protein